MFATIASFGVLVASLQAPASPPDSPLDCSVVANAEMHDTAVARFKEGEAALLASKWTEAEAVLLRAIGFDPLLALAHYGLGQAYMSEQRFKDAVSAFSRAREAFRCAPPLSEEERKRRTDEIRGLRESLRTADQRRLKEIAAQWKQVNGDIRTGGDGILKSQDVERRLLELEGSLKSNDPVPLGVTLALGTALFQTGAIAEAEVAFRAVLARDAGSGDAHNNLAVVCMMTDRIEEAEKEMTAAQKAGIPVNPRLKQEIERRKKAAPASPHS